MLDTRVVRRVAVGLAIAALAFAIAIPALAVTNPGSPKKGKVIFVANCSTCHVLKAAKAVGTIGPNLDQKKPSYKLIITRVTNGKAPMIPFKGTLTTKQIQDVAAFVYNATHGLPLNK
jgi:mono/diheme cytochrome c family protein